MDEMGWALGLAVTGSELWNRDGRSHQISHSLRPVMLEPAIIRFAVPEFAEQRVLAKVIDVPVHLFVIGDATLMPSQAAIEPSDTTRTSDVQIPTRRECVACSLAIERDVGRLRQVEDEDVNASRFGS